MDRKPFYSPCVINKRHSHAQNLTGAYFINETTGNLCNDSTDINYPLSLVNIDLNDNGFLVDANGEYGSIDNSLDKLITSERGTIILKFKSLSDIDDGVIRTLLKITSGVSYILCRKFSANHAIYMILKDEASNQFYLRISHLDCPNWTTGTQISFQWDKNNTIFNGQKMAISIDGEYKTPAQYYVPSDWGSIDFLNDPITVLNDTSGANLFANGSLDYLLFYKDYIVPENTIKSINENPYAMVYKPKYFISALSAHNPYVPIANTYYCRADGTAPNKSAAIGPITDTSACMTLTVHNSESFSPGDTIILSDRGGRFLEILIPPSSGSLGSPITYVNETSEAPIISGSDDEGTYSYERAYCVKISSKDYVTIDGLECRYSGGVGIADGECIQIDGDCVGVIVQNCHAHHNKNEALKIIGTSSVTSNNNVFHDNLDSDVSLHDQAIWYSNGDEMYDSPRGIENIGTSFSYVDNANIHDHTNFEVQIYLNDPYLRLTNSTVDAKSLPLVSCVEVLNDASIDMSGCTIKNGVNLIRLLSTGTNTIIGNTFQNSTTYGIDASSGINSIHNNTFKKCVGYGVISRAGNVMHSFRNHFTDLGGVYGGGYNLTGEFYCAGNLHDNAPAFNYYVSGTVNPLSTIANCYMNDSGLRGIDANSKAFNIYNCAIRSSVQANYNLISNAIVKNCISDKTELPAGDGNVNSANFLEYFESITAGESNFALPIVDAGADGTGINTELSDFNTYFNSINVVTNEMDIGAKGLQKVSARKIKHFGASAIPFGL